MQNQIMEIQTSFVGVPVLSVPMCPKLLVWLSIAHTQALRPACEDLEHPQSIQTDHRANHQHQTLEGVQPGASEATRYPAEQHSLRVIQGQRCQTNRSQQLYW